MGKKLQNEGEKHGRTLYDLIFYSYKYIASKRWLLILLVILVIVLGSGYLYYTLKDGGSSETKNASDCKSWTITGKLFDKNGKTLTDQRIIIGALSGPFSYDNYIRNGVFRITNVTIPTDNFLQIYIENEGKQTLIYREPIRENRHLIDSNNCTITFIENIVVEENMLPSKPQKPAEQKKSFSILNKDMDYVEKLLVQSGLRLNKLDPDYKINFTFSGDLEKIANTELYRYNGGYLKIIVNNIECAELKNLRINSTSNIGNRYSVVIDEINERIIKLTSDHIVTCVSNLKRCL